MDDLAAILVRIESRLEALGLSANGASKLAGKPDAIRNIRRAVKEEDRSGRSGVSTATIAALAGPLQTTLAWLLEGTGSEEATGAVTHVPLVSWVSAGRLTDSATQIPRSETATIPFADLGAGDFIALRVQGDSMDRVSPEGSIIVVNRRDNQLQVGKPYVFTIRGEATYKFWQPKPPRLEPFSTNPANTAKYIDTRRGLFVVGRVRPVALPISP